MGLIKTTAVFSLAVQIVTGLIDVYVLTLPTSVEIRLLKQLLYDGILGTSCGGNFLCMAALYHYQRAYKYYTQAVLGLDHYHTCHAYYTVILPYLFAYQRKARVVCYSFFL